MRRIGIVGAFLICSLLPAGTAEEKGVGGSSFHKNDITYSSSVDTPHVKWATKLPGGPIKGFFIPSVQYGRDMVELMQRLDLSPTTVTIDRNWDTNCWGIGDYYGHEYRGDRDDFQIVYSYVEKDLIGPAQFEVLVIPGLNGWSRMTRPTRDAILKRVNSGAGLILIHPFVGDVKNHPFKADEREGDTRIWEVSPLVDCPDDFVGENGYPELNRSAITSGKWEITRSHFITAGLPVSLLPEGNVGGSFYKYKARGEVLVKSGEYPIIATGNYGKGRVVSLGYLEDGFIPSASNPGGISDLDGFPASTMDPTSTGIYWDYWEYYYSLLARAVIWAAGRDGSLEIRSLKAQPAGDDALRVVLSTPTPLKIEVDVAAKSAVQQECGSYKVTAALPGGETALSMPASALRPAPGWPGGKVIFDVILRDPATGATLNWASADIDFPRRATITGISPAADVYRRGETLSAVVRASGDLSSLNLRLRASDDLGRSISSESRPARPERYVYCGLQDFIGKYVNLTAELVDSRGRIVDQLRARPVLVVQESRRQKEYNPMVAFGGSKHFFEAARMRQLHAAATDTGFTWGGSINNGLNIPRGAFGVYWYDRGPTTPEAMERAIRDYQQTRDFESLQYLTKKELYRRTGDTRFLARNPSFLNNAFIDRLKNIVFAVARGKARYNMDYYFVGDEGSLTSYTDPYDFDWAPEALVAFRRWLEQEYGSLAALNQSWRSKFTRWEDVYPYTTEQAVKVRNYAPWADHRTFMEVSFAGAYQSVRDAVVRGDPEAHIALSGTQVTTAYDGCDWYRLDRVIDDFISYDGGNQWDLHRSFAKPGSMIG
ncbi:MAG TPA: beta-galactosidase, partial [Acidobacteriota bacterium]|nr:beta-galactosidase [Acidobacteriota bacterium]